MSGEALYLLWSFVAAYLVYIVVTRGGRGVLWYLWRRGRVAVRVWAAKVSRGGSKDDEESVGVLDVPTKEREAEQRKPFVTDRHEDVVSLTGMDGEGRAVVIRAARLSYRRASVFLSVTDRDGCTYTLPNQPDTSLVNVDGEGWGGAGLSLTCVDPMKLWRVKFNGLLRRGTKEEYITEGEQRAGKEEEKEEKQHEIVHARLDLLWRSMRGPVESVKVMSPSLLSKAIAPFPYASPKDYLEEEKDSYDQWGCLHGTVRLQHGGTADTWYLRGARRHRWGLDRGVGRGLNTDIYFKNGDLFSLRARCHSSTSPQYIIGYLYKASGRLYPVTWCDLDLNQLDNLDRMGHNLLIRFTAGGRTYETWQRLDKTATYYTGDPWTCGHVVYRGNAAASHSHGYALTTLSSRYTALCPVPERESLPRVEAPMDWAGDGVPLVVTLEDPRCRDPALTGGKGSSLALVTAYKELLEPDQESYEVPPGIVITSRAFEVQVASSPDLQQAIRNLRLATAAGQPARQKEACSRVVELCKGLDVCPEVTEEIFTLLEEVTDTETTRLAVRSSGCVEDGSEASAAGQNETVLGVAGRDAVLRAVLTCWASLFTYHSVEYRRQHGQPVECGMGVVVQEMVEAHTAGVIFTVDPATGDPSSITITANYGLGESVVSAGAEPDTVVVKRSWRDTLTLRTKTVGGKATMCVMKEGGGTQEVEVEASEQKQVCVSDEEALRLARVALYLHQAFAGPRDIEFAITKKGSIIAVLQARPVTTLNAWTQYELTHECDTATLTDDDPISKGNTGEVLPGSTSPLGFSVVVKVLDMIFQRQNKHAVDTHHMYMVNSFYSHVFLNVSETLYHNIDGDDAAFRTICQAMDMAVFGHFVTTKELIDNARERFGVMKGLRKLYLFLQLISYKVSLRRRTITSYQDKYKDYKVPQGRDVTACTLYAEITRRLPDLEEVTHAHLCLSSVASTCEIIVFLMLAADSKGLSSDNISDMAILLSSCTGTESAEVPAALKELSRVIRKSEEAEEFLGMSPDEAQVWLHSHPGHVGALFRHFLARHGHRGLKELDLQALSWRDNPHGLVTTLQMMTQHAANDSPSPPPPNDVDDLLDTLRTPLSHSSRRSIKFMLPICRESVYMREATKSLLVKVIDGLRKGYRELGRLLMSEERIPNPDLVFYLSHSELGDLVANSCPALVMKAQGKLRLHPQLENLTFQELSLGVPKPIKKAADGGRERAAGEGAVTLDGTPVFCGKVQGTARVVTRLQDADSIQNGDILVTVCTDIGWSPYFPLLSGVVTELGGLFSHGAVVAREYGLPCLVGVVGATTSFNSGDQVLLDSTCGKLSLIKPTSSPSSSSSSS